MSDGARPGFWASHASTRRDMVRRGYDTLRWVEHRLSPGIDVPRGGFPLVPLHESAVTQDNRIALTFDDGPHPDQTPRLLDELGARGLRATFYVIGERAREHPDVVKRAFEEGHTIGSHTWSHRFLTTQRSGSIIDELTRTDQVVEEITGVRPSTLRPPYGATTPGLAAWTSYQFGYETVLWSVDSKDYDDDATVESVTGRILDQTVPGAIILTHDPLPHTIDAMTVVLDRFADRGLVLTTVDELISVS